MRLVGFIIKKFVTMHSHMKVKNLLHMKLPYVACIVRNRRSRGAYKENIQNFHPYTHYEHKKCRRRSRVEKLIFASGVNAVDSPFP